MYGFETTQWPQSGLIDQSKVNDINDLMDEETASFSTQLLCEVEIHPFI
jgi:hypothetical protein